MNYKEVFAAKYDRISWLKLLHDVFQSKAKFDIEPYKKINVSSQLAKVALYLGKIMLSPSEELAVYEVELANNVDIVRNRRGIRDMLTSDWRSRGYVGAFVLTFRKRESILRFSYISEIWGFNDKNEYVKTSTDTKRFTYLLGEGYSCRTAVEQFEKLSRSDKTLADVTAAFNVEALSKEFFAKYKEHYDLFVKYMVKTPKLRNEFIDKDFNRAGLDAKHIKDREEKPIRDYVKKLLGRIVFLHFLQKKGWLGVPEGERWGEGDRNFMFNLFDKASEEQKRNFLDGVLEPLFADALDTDRKADNHLFDTKVKGIEKVRIPYLNGGLFERDELDEKSCSFPPELFKNLLDTFSQYNFTIDENDPNDAEVGVDPEMLGRIFENLLEDNKDKGAFYTPKEIVQYMCRESLIAYLQTDENAEVLDGIRQFVTKHDANELSSSLQETIGEKLRNVKICDPAIGSGAFPMGLLRELFFCRCAIDPHLQEDSATIKRDIIQNNIYGVDIERGAVDIARLRFWLSLIVDEKDPNTLPNLDYKIMQGNSLLEGYKGVDLSNLLYDFEQNIKIYKEINYQTNIFDKEIDYWRSQLSKLMEEYYSCDDHNKRKKLRKDISNLVLQQIKIKRDNVSFEDVDVYANNQFFLWHTWFNDVFPQIGYGGFDIVIGNPPYGAKCTKEEKATYKKNFQTARSIPGEQKGSLDTYTLFIEQGYNLLRKNGCFAYIVPISITSSESLTGVHNLLLKNCETISISSYAVRPQPVFEEAVVDVSILMFRKTETRCLSLRSTKMNRKGAGFNLQRLIDSLHFVEVRDLTLYGRIPKIGTSIEKNILCKLLNYDKLSSFVKERGLPIYYRTSGGRYFKVVTNYRTGSTKEKPIRLQQEVANSIGCILSSSFSFWFYQIYSNNHDWKRYEIDNFPLPPLNDKDIDYLDALYERYLEDIEANANLRTSSGKSTYKVDTFKEYKIVRSKHIIDEIDDYICPLYGLTQEETDFIKNYELEFRLSGDSD